MYKLFVGLNDKPCLGPSISILSSGILDSKDFLHEFPVSDRRSLKSLKVWSNGIKTLLVDVFHRGGQVYKDWIAAIEDGQELLEMLLDEDHEKPVRRNLKKMRAFFNLAHKLLNCHQHSAGSGNIIYSLVNSQEFKDIFGAFECELISQSHRMEC